MIMLKVNGEFIEVDVPQADIGGVQEYKKLVEDLYSEKEDIKNAANALGTSLIKTNMGTQNLMWSYSNTSLSGHQGGCTDGKNVYFYIKAYDDAGIGLLVKKPISGGTASTRSVALGHGNDITYHKPTDSIFVVAMDDAPTTIYQINANTLETIKVRSVPFYTSAIAYEPGRDVFVGGYGGDTKTIFRLNPETDEFETVRTITCTSPSYASGKYTSQGIGCDSAFIYHCWCKTENNTATVIEIFNWLGSYVGALTFTASAEIEWIDKLGKNEFIMGVYNNAVPRSTYVYTFTTS